MTVDEKVLIERCIILPLALKVFIIDQKHFENFYSANAYLDIFESVTEQIRKDIMETKERLYNQYNIIVQKQSNTQYLI